MAPKVLREGREISFADEVRVIHPLTIRQLRKFLRVVEGLNTEADTLTDDDISKMVEAAAIALEKDYPEVAKDLDELEDILDLRSFNLLLSAAMGADPNV